MESPYEIVEGIDRVDFERVHGWLTNSYWSPGISFEKVVRAARGTAMVLSVFFEDEQVGYVRIISDKTTFAWVADMYVDDAHRGRGLAKKMLRYAQEHPEMQGLRRWALATKDAHEVYAACGFEPLWEPQRWMIYFPSGPPKQTPD